MHNQAVYALSSRWAELYNQGDFQGVADLYTEDGIFANALGRFEGREAIREHFAGPKQVEGATINPATDEVEIFGDTAYGMGTYVHSAPDGSTIMQGAWLGISKLVDGEWKMHRHIVNMLMPEPKADAH